MFFLRNKNNSHLNIQHFNNSAKKGFTIIEVTFVFLLMLGVIFLVLPKSLHNTNQARFISKWSQTYSSLEYMFSVMIAQQNGELREKFRSAKNNQDKQEILLETIKPYLRITSQVNEKYEPAFMDKSKIEPLNDYYFEKFYFTSANEIVGLKWLNSDCGGGTVCALISIDINGLTPPNSWGYDIFGINVLKNSIEPLGKNISQDALKINCDKRGYGTYCSYYYLIGGKFE